MGIENRDIDNMLQYLEIAPSFIEGDKIEKIREMLSELRQLREAPVWGPPPGHEDVTPDNLYGDFEVVLMAVGPNRILVIKALREILGCTRQ